MCVSNLISSNPDLVAGVRIQIVLEPDKMFFLSRVESGPL